MADAEHLAWDRRTLQMCALGLMQPTRFHRTLAAAGRDIARGYVRDEDHISAVYCASDREGMGDVVTPESVSVFVCIAEGETSEAAIAASSKLLEAKRKALAMHGCDDPSHHDILLPACKSCGK